MKSKICISDNALSVENNLQVSTKLDAASVSTLNFRTIRAILSIQLNYNPTPLHTKLNSKFIIRSLRKQ
jgi:hypothetical protein